MQLSELAASLGITAKLPEKLLAFSENYREEEGVACDVAIVDILQKEHNLFGEFIEPIKQAAEQINADKTCSAWVKLTSQYALQVEFPDARAVPVPPADGTVMMDFLPLFMLLPQIPVSIAEYRRRGFPEEELESLLRGYAGGISVVRSQTGRPGVNQLYYSWLTHYTKAMIFRFRGLQFEKFALPAGAFWLQNKQTGEIVPLQHNAVLCADGKHILGSAGYTECEETFQVCFEEDAENYYGYPTYNCVVSSRREVYPKAQWECLAKPGDDCLNMHIPRGADISRSNMLEACKGAMELAAQRYPDCNARVICCTSWLLDPTLGEILGDHANITAFQRCFTRFPIKSSATDIFNSVFGGQRDNLQSLPEDTSLQRKIKERILKGGHIYAYSGIYTG